MTLMLDGAYRPGLQRRQVNELIVLRPEKLPRPLRADELARLLAHLSPTARLASQWALGAGLRRKALFALALDQCPARCPLDLGIDPLDRHSTVQGNIVYVHDDLRGSQYLKINNMTK